MEVQAKAIWQVFTEAPILPCSTPACTTPPPPTHTCPCPLCLKIRGAHSVSQTPLQVEDLSPGPPIFEPSAGLLQWPPVSCLAPSIPQQLPERACCTTSLSLSLSPCRCPLRSKRFSTWTVSRRGQSCGRCNTWGSLSHA